LKSTHANPGNEMTSKKKDTVKKGPSGKTKPFGVRAKKTSDIRGMSNGCE